METEETLNELESNLSNLRTEVELLDEKLDKFISELSEKTESIEIHESEPGIEAVAACSKGSFIVGANGAVFFKANPDNNLKAGDEILEFDRGSLKVGHENQVFYSPK